MSVVKRKYSNTGCLGIRIQSLNWFSRCKCIAVCSKKSASTIFCKESDPSVPRFSNSTSTRMYQWTRSLARGRYEFEVDRCPRERYEETSFQQIFWQKLCPFFLVFFWVSAIIFLIVFTLDYRRLEKDGNTIKKEIQQIKLNEEHVMEGIKKFVVSKVGEAEERILNDIQNYTSEDFTNFKISLLHQFTNLTGTDVSTFYFISNISTFFVFVI